MVLGGAYCLCIGVDRDLDVEIGALGLLKFSMGCYVYVGSALSGLEARIRRHIKTSQGLNQTLKWHIDYLLKETEVNIDSVYIQVTKNRTECIIANEILRMGRPVKGFGCSDCRCVSHLFEVDDCNFFKELGLKKKPV